MPTKEKKNVKKLSIPKVEVLDTTEDISIPKQPVTEEVKKHLTTEAKNVVEITTIKKVVKSDVQIKAEKEEAERVDPLPFNEVAEAIEPSVILVPLGTNHRQIRLAFDVRTNKVQAKDIPDIIQVVLKKAAPMIGEMLVQAINVEKNLLDATKQK